MKKVMMMVVAAMMATVNVNAQSDEPRNEIGISYGLGISLLGDGIGNGISNGIFDQLGGNKWANSKEFGSLGIEYFRHLDNPKLAVGGIVTFSRNGEDVVTKKEETKVGERTRNYISVMPAIKYYYVNKKHFGLYSKAAVGLMLMNSKSEDLQAKTSATDNKLYFTYQLSLLGIEAGSQNLRAFIEGGAGEQGILMAGVRMKF